MAEKPAAPAPGLAAPPRDETQTPTQQDFRLACRRYSRMRSRMQG